jgi:hypothetical protein
MSHWHHQDWQQGDEPRQRRREIYQRANPTRILSTAAYFATNPLHNLDRDGRGIDESSSLNRTVENGATTYATSAEIGKPKKGRSLADAEEAGLLGSIQGMEILLCASLSCFVGGTMYSYGVWGLSLQQDTGLTSLQTNILAGLIFSGGSFLTNTIIWHCGISLKWAGLTPSVIGAIAYLMLGLAPIEGLSFGALLVLIGMVGYSVMGLFICAIQAVNYLNKLTGFNTNVGTAIAQTSYGLGCMFWVVILHDVCDDKWRKYCIAVAFSLVGVGLLCFMVYPHSRDVTGTTSAVVEEEAPLVAANASNFRSTCVLVVVVLLYTCWFGTAICLQTNAAVVMQSVGKTSAAVQMTVLFGVFQTIGRVSSLMFAIWAKSGSTSARGGGGDKDQQYRQRILWQPIVGVTLLLLMHLVLVLYDSPPYATRQAIIAASGIPYGLSWTSLFHVCDALFDSHDSIITLGMIFGPGLGDT